MVIVSKDGARVLVVDDEPNITELVAMALRYEGFDVKTAMTGRAALTAVSQFSPSLVILDVMLPDIDGLEVLKRLNSSGNKVPIIFLTAKDEYRLLRYLLINAGRVLTRSQILDHVWHYDFGGDASVLETYISYLRRKVDRYDPPLVQTVRGVGYVLRTPRK